MQFSDTSGKTGIIEDIDFLAGTDATSYPLVDKARRANIHYYRVMTDILKSNNRLQYDDSNLGTLPKVDLTMVEGTHEVALPDANMMTHAVEVKDNAGNWVRIQEIDLSEKRTSISSFTTSSGFPRFYDTLGGFLYLDPAPTATSVTLTSGLRVWVAREVDIFLSSDTAQQPSFAEPYHEIIALGCAFDYAVINGPEDRAEKYGARYEQLREEVRQFYSGKNKDVRTKFRPAHDTRQYL